MLLYVRHLILIAGREMERKRKKVGIATGHFKLRRGKRGRNSAIMLRWVSNGAIHPSSNFHGSVKTHCRRPLSPESQIWKAFPSAWLHLYLAIEFDLIGFVSTYAPNARIDINLERKICRYNGFGAVSTAVGGQMTFWGRRRSSVVSTSQRYPTELDQRLFPSRIRMGPLGLGHPARFMLNQIRVNV